MLGDPLLGPYVLPECLDGAKYLVFLQHVLPELLQGVVPLSTRCGSCTMLHHIFRLRCVATSMLHIPKGGPVTWPPRSADFNTLDFFFWGHLKSLVYETLVTTVEDRRRFS
ncbi:uncharacterized protein TNCV_500121 [Trichonephila clavipes]|nr:uncharacterized protein TNCV_500121 [Trichonephila clavipes]